MLVFQGGLASVALSGAEVHVGFNRDIRPILAENCFACHGPDKGSREAGLRFDTKEGIFDGTADRDPAVVPGSLAKSELWHRITTTDVDDVMPPADSNLSLEAEQKEKLKQWILAGAPWQGHWAFIKPERPDVPLFQVQEDSESSSGFQIRNPIDAFVLAKLKAEGLTPAPVADRRTLARRLSLDLTGLPPRPEVVQEFVTDPAPDAYERFVKQLLASPHWGEHRARYWLDAARYADTHGLHFDNYREIWPYRDWVIRAFNDNMSFAQFTLEQCAGDLLEDPTIDQKTATGFHRCNMTTNEGGTIDEENEANYAADRVTTTSWVWLGLTANCAVCHDHKFDPVTMKDFYSMAAFFRNTTQPPKDGNSRSSPPSISVPQTPDDRRRWIALPREVSVAKARLDRRREEAGPSFTNWLNSLKPEDLDDPPRSSELLVHLQLNEVETNFVRALAGTLPKVQLPEDPEWKDGEIGPALVLKKGRTLEVGDQGDFEKDNAFSYGCWVWVNRAKGTGGIIARMDSENEYRGWDLCHNGKQFSAHFVHQWPENAIKVATQDNVVKEKTWQHVFVTYDGSGRASGVKLYVDGLEKRVKVEKDGLAGSIRTQVPLRIGQRNHKDVLEGGRAQDIRIFSVALTDSEVGKLASAARIRSFLDTPKEERSEELRNAIFDFWLGAHDESHINLAETFTLLAEEQKAIRGRSPVTLILEEKKDSEATAHILFRGQYDKPREKVFADTFAVLPPIPEGAPKNRLGLARWLTAPDNPLTARVTVNRFWAELFGVGIVRTAEDFGVAGETPVNQDLLDWLAVEFQESGWDIKHIFELIVSSSAYRQSTETTPDKLAKDPENRFLSRGSRFRMDAEMVRDYALAVSGLLTEAIGGPSVKPYQPDGVWSAVAMPESNTKKYKRDTGKALYRRSLYTFWKRAAPPATMDLFNAPSRETCVVARERTNTPLQALVTLNDPQFIEAACELAGLALAAGGRRDDVALDVMARRLLARPLTAEESKIVRRTLQEAESYYEVQPAAADELLAIGESRPSDEHPPARLAAMTLVANQLLNLDEVLNK